VLNNVEPTKHLSNETDSSLKRTLFADRHGFTITLEIKMTFTGVEISKLTSEEEFVPQLTVRRDT
jgi:hypothetical protein